MTPPSLCVFDPPREPFTLPAVKGWPEQRHQFEEDSVWAIQAALVTGRPLLVRGEPGTGKSQLARAAAHVLHRPFLYEVITSRTEVTDLLWHFDAVARLGEAQIQAACGVKESAEVRANLHAERFVSPGKLWWALNWPSAARQADLAGAAGMECSGEAWRNGCVLLIDEIDKADAELPNALLECFANQSFQVPYRREPVERDAGQPPPLVVVTTNEERELPAPFLRRCLVLHLGLERDEEKLKAFLVGRGKVHFEEEYKDRHPDFAEILLQAADQLIQDRRQAGAGAVYRPGQAEYLDLCRAVFEIAAGDGRRPLDILAAVARFTMQKNPL